MKKITILNFSSRIGGNCASVSEMIKDRYNGTNMRIVRVGDYFKPCSGCDYECLRHGAKCPVMDSDAESIMKDICDSDITYYVIPNYCGGPCANYYAFNERSVGWFDGDRNKMDRCMSVNKRFVFISNSMTEAFQDVVRQQCTGGSEVLQLATRKYSKRSIDGDLLGSDEAVADLIRFIGPEDL